MTRNQHVIALFCEGIGVEEIFTYLIHKESYGHIKKAFKSEDEVEEVIRKALRRHGRQGRKAK